MLSLLNLYLKIFWLLFINWIMCYKNKKKKTFIKINNNINLNKSLELKNNNIYVFWVDYILNSIYFKHYYYKKYIIRKNKFKKTNKKNIIIKNMIFSDSTNLKYEKTKMNY